MTDQTLTVDIGGTAYVLTLPMPLALTPAGGTVTTPPPPPPPPAGTVPYPAALAAGHALLHEYLPNDLLPWRFQADGKTPVVNGSGVSENPASPRNVEVTADGGVSVLKLSTTNAGDCGVIQSPAKYPTSSGVIETLIKFSGLPDGSGHFADWGSLWMYGDNWPANGEIDAVETSYGNSYVSYHYGTNGQNTEATTNPWTYLAKQVQLQPKNSTSVPAAPNILPDKWTYVTLAFGPGKVDVYYDGTLYCTIAGPYVTGAPMYITAGLAFGAPGLGGNQAPYDAPGSIEIQYVRVFS